MTLTLSCAPRDLTLGMTLALSCAPRDLALGMTLHPQCRHVFSAEILREMKPTACLLNVGRGAVVDEEALIQVPYPSPMAVSPWVP